MHELISKLPCPKCGQEASCVYNSDKTTDWWWTVYCRNCQYETSLRSLIGEIFAQKMGVEIFIDDPHQHHITLISDQGVVDVMFFHNRNLHLNMTFDFAAKSQSIYHDLQRFTGQLFTKFTINLAGIPATTACPICGTRSYQAKDDWLACSCGYYRVLPSALIVTALKERGYSLQTTAKNSWLMHKAQPTKTWWVLRPRISSPEPIGVLNLSSKNIDKGSIHTFYLEPTGQSRPNFRSIEKLGLHLIVR